MAVNLVLIRTYYVLIRTNVKPYHTRFRTTFQCTSKNPDLRASATQIACLPHFIPTAALRNFLVPAKPKVTLHCFFVFHALHLPACRFLQPSGWANSEFLEVPLRFPENSGLGMRLQPLTKCQRGRNFTQRCRPLSRHLNQTAAFLEVVYPKR